MFERIPLAGPAIPAPALFYSPDTELRAPVIGGYVTVKNERYRVLDPAVAEGEILQVHPRGFAIRVSALEEAARIAAEADDRRRAEEEIARAARADADRDTAALANAAIVLPIRWSPAYRAVASGVSARGHGGGGYALTVIHVRCDEPLLHGRMRRSEMAFLCGVDGGAMGYVVDAVSHDSAGQAYPDRVTCRGCLATATRLAKVTA